MTILTANYSRRSKKKDEEREGIKKEKFRKKTNFERKGESYF